MPRFWICKNRQAPIVARRGDVRAAGLKQKNCGPVFIFCSRLLPLIVLALFLAACGNAPKTAAPNGLSGPAPQTAPAPVAGENATGVAQPAACWAPLQRKLVADGLPAGEVEKYLAALAPTPTQSPMGRKMLELYRRKFFPPAPKAQQQRYYKGVVTETNAVLCRDFIKNHERPFELAQKRYGVPPSIAAALLFVETRLGKVLGDVPENAFYTLASMAVCTKPGDISQWLPKMKGYEKHLGWMDETMQKRGAWAYNETRALLEHIIRDNVPPDHLPGSIYGAVGLCQFMPSNISSYGADGDGDGRVDLFTVPDAVMSLSNYLYKHGWRSGQSREKQHKLLMTYNHSQIYANTILALADLVRGGQTENGK